jgi:hypothetical protein
MHAIGREEAIFDTLTQACRYKPKFLSG